MAPPRFFDLRSEREAKPPKIRVVGGKPVLRRVAAIDSICLHQTAVAFGASSAQIKAAGGDRDLALARRGLDVACHAIAFEGCYAAVAPLAWHVNHGNGWNARSLGLEVDGLYAGLQSDPKTIWGGKPPTALTPHRIESARAALRWLVEAGRAAGMPIKRIVAHRQSSATRRSDPGQELWRELALWAADELDVETAPADVLGDGRPVPSSWDPRGVGRY